MPLSPEVSSALPRRLATVVVRPVVVGRRSTGSALLVLRRRSTGSALLVLWRRPTRSTTTDLRRGARRDPLDRKWPVALLARRLQHPQPYRWRLRQVRR